MIFELSEHTFIDLQEDWSQLWGKYNWYGFTFINLYFENDAMTKGCEFEFGLLGFRFRIRHNTKKGLAVMNNWVNEKPNPNESAP